MENTLKSKILTRFLLVLLVVALGLAGYFYSQVRSLKQDPQVVAQQEVADLMLKVGKLVVLPEGELPTVATVSDPEALKDQPFFSKAQMGDKVLIFAEAKKAVLYSVTLNKVIDVAPLNIGSTKAVTPPASQTEN